MTNYHAKTTKALLEIFIPYPPELLAQLDARRNETTEVMAQLPEWLRPHPQMFYEFDPLIRAFEDAQNWDAIRAEIARKAKKLGVTVGHDVGWKQEPKGLRIEVWGKA